MLGKYFTPKRSGPKISISAELCSHGGLFRVTGIAITLVTYEASRGIPQEERYVASAEFQEVVDAGDIRMRHGNFTSGSPTAPRELCCARHLSCRMLRSNNWMVEALHNGPIYLRIQTRRSLRGRFVKYG